MIARRLSDAQYFLLQSQKCFDLARQESEDPSMEKALRQASEHVGQAGSGGRGKTW